MINRITEIKTKIPKRQNPRLPVEINGKMHTGVSGGQAVWLPDGETGTKITTKKRADVVNYLKSIDGYEEFLPKIHDSYVVGDFLVMVCENIEEGPTDDGFINRSIRWFIDNQIIPDKGWSKSKNIQNNKLIDFHYFDHKKENYYFPIKSVEKIENVHKKALESFKRDDPRKLPKWKGKIYQGMRFTDGVNQYTMPGYSSDKKYFDSQIKMQFSSTDFCSGKSVLDIGCNEGFFIHQARLNGSTRCVGIDISEEDIVLANGIAEEMVVDQDNYEFLATDAIEYLKNSESFDVVYLHSVVHRIYDTLSGTEQFFKDITKKVNRLVIYETPYEHPRMSAKLPELEKVLKKYFAQVRPLYSYNAYSSGRRKLYALYK